MTERTAATATAAVCCWCPCNSIVATSISDCRGERESGEGESGERESGERESGERECGERESGERDLHLPLV